MEIAVYSFLFLILFLGVIFNLKITNTKRVIEIRKKLKKNYKFNKRKFNISNKDL